MAGAGVEVGRRVDQLAAEQPIEQREQVAQVFSGGCGTRGRSAADPSTRRFVGGRRATRCVRGLSLGLREHGMAGQRASARRRLVPPRRGRAGRRTRRCCPCSCPRTCVSTPRSNAPRVCAERRPAAHRGAEPVRGRPDRHLCLGIDGPVSQPAIPPSASTSIAASSSSCSRFDTITEKILIVGVVGRRGGGRRWGSLGSPGAWGRQEKKEGRKRNTKKPPPRAGAGRGHARAWEKENGREGARGAAPDGGGGGGGRGEGPGGGGAGGGRQATPPPPGGARSALRGAGWGGPGAASTKRGGRGGGGGPRDEGQGGPGEDDVALALVADAELFRLEAIVRWLDAADVRLKQRPPLAPAAVAEMPLEPTHQMEVSQ